MEFTTVLFYIFALLTVFASFGVITARNPVYSVLWLIFAFFNSAGIFVLLGAEMLAMLLVIVYVGAVAVLFLFVVMMLNIKTAALKKGFQAYLPIGLILALILFVELAAVVYDSSKKLDLKAKIVVVEAPETSEEVVTNAEAIGRVLYTDYILYFQTSGLILFVAMIGAIVLTLRTRTGVRRQNIKTQISRKAKETLEVVKVNVGEGVK